MKQYFSSYHPHVVVTCVFNHFWLHSESVLVVVKHGKVRFQKTAHHHFTTGDFTKMLLRKGTAFYKMRHLFLNR